MSIVSVPGTSAELRYSPVEKPSNSVVPDRFYQSSVDINLKSIDIIAQPHLHNDLDMLVIVRSSPEHFQRRDAIRMTWGESYCTCLFYFYLVSSWEAIFSGFFHE